MKRMALAVLFLSVFSFPVLAADHGDDVFNRMDSEKDQQITLDEFLAGEMSVHKGENDIFHVTPTGPEGQAADPATSEKYKRALFERIDADRNGVINNREWMDSVSTGVVIFRY